MTLPAAPVPDQAERETPALPARHTGLALFALIVGGFAVGTTEFMSMGLLPQVADGVDVDIPTAGHAISAYALGVVVGAPTIAIACAKLPRRALLVALLAAFIVGNAATAAARSYPALLGARFLTGLPHGAYFGVATLLAASVVPPALRGRAIGRLMYGIPAANLLGVPLTTWLGQQLGWRQAYAFVAAIGVVTIGLVVAFIPSAPGNPDATGRRELAGLNNLRLWLSVLTGAIGFGGMFAVISYIAPIVTDVAGQPEGAVPIYLLISGIGGLLGAELAGRLSEWSIFRSVVLGLVLMASVLAAFWLVAPWHVPGVIVFALMSTVASILVINLQMQLMHDAGPAETLGAALNHSGLNIANALGAWLGGLVITAGLGYRSTALVGIVLALVGLAVLVPYRILDRRTGHPLR